MKKSSCIKLHNYNVNEHDYNGRADACVMFAMLGKTNLSTLHTDNVVPQNVRRHCDIFVTSRVCRDNGVKSQAKLKTLLYHLLKGNNDKHHLEKVHNIVIEHC